jgi:hypothetical protein
MAAYPPQYAGGNFPGRSGPGAQAGQRFPNGMPANGIPPAGLPQMPNQARGAPQMNGGIPQRPPPPAGAVSGAGRPAQPNYRLNANTRNAPPAGTAQEGGPPTLTAQALANASASDQKREFWMFRKEHANQDLESLPSPVC